MTKSLVYITITSFMVALMALLAPDNWIGFLIIGISGLIFLLIHQIFAKEKIKAYLHSVVIFFYVAFAVFICWLTRQMNLPYILIPFLVIQYLLQYTLNNLYVYHDLFIEECGQLKGKELEAHLFHNNLSAIDFGATARVVQYLLTILPCAMLLAILAVMKAGYSLSLFSLIFIMIFFAGDFFNFFMLGLFRNDVFLGFLGFRNYINNKRRLLRSVFVILGAACIFGGLLSSNKAFIKISFGYMPAPVVNEQHAEMGQYEPVDFYNPAEDFAKLFPETKRIIPEWFWDLLFGIIKWAAISALSIGVIIFLLKPFFSAHWKIFWKEGRLFKFLKNVFSDIRDFLRSIFTRNTTEQPYSTIQSQKFGEGIKDFMKKAGRSKEKNAEIDRLTKHFMKLIDWGEAHKIQYLQNFAPAEYTALFNNETANLAGILFEKALYDKNVLTAEEEKQFIEAVEKILKTAE